MYNLSELSRNEAENLIREKEGRLCVRFFRRADGTILTKDCPVGLRAARLKFVRMAGVVAAFVAGLIGGNGLLRRCGTPLSCEPAVNHPAKLGNIAPMMGEAALLPATAGVPVMPKRFMGKVAVRRSDKAQ